MPPHEYHFWVYIMASRSLQLYIGVTNNLHERVFTHKLLVPGSYTAQYNITRLVYFEHFKYIRSAIAREKQLKDWNRERKLELIKGMNFAWQDLSLDLG